MSAEPRKLSPEEVRARLAPTHLIPETEDLKAEAEQAVAPEAQDDVEAKIDPRSEREYTFPFSWKDGRGKVWKGEFTNKILSIRERQQVGIVRARLAGGVPSIALDSHTENINLMVAHMMFSLTKYPDWAKDLTKLDDFRILEELYWEVASHEAFFLGYGEDALPSREEPEGGSGTGA